MVPCLYPKGKSYALLIKSFRYNGERINFQPYYVANFVLTSKPDKDILKKETYRPISIMITGQEIINKIL